MKLPPLALTAPSLCPRCDAPAMFADECAQCALPLRRCGSCQGVAGPFDRFCGFCGHELVLGRKRSAAWRLWLLAGLVPILAALGLGLSPLGQAAVKSVQGGPPAPAPSAARPNVTDRNLGFSLVAPKGWTYAGGTSVGALTSDQADGPVAAAGPAALVTAGPHGAVVLLGRPAVSAPGVDASDPVAVLAFQTAQLMAAPPAGITLATVTPVSARTIAGRRGALSVLSVIGSDGTARVFERAYVSVPGGLFLVEALIPPGDSRAFSALLSSLSLTS